MDTPGFDVNPYSFLPLWALVTLGAGLLALAFLSYRRTTRPISRRTRHVLLALRAIAIVLVCLMLARPSMTYTSSRNVKKPLLVLVDRSRSMTELKDAGGGSMTRWEAGQAILDANKQHLDALAETHNVQFMHFGREQFDPDVVDPGDLAQATAYGVSLRGALRELRESDTQSESVDAVIILGDGCNNTGRATPESVAADLAAKRIPIYTVGLGQDAAGSLLRDIAVGDVVAPKSAFRFTKVAVRTEITVRGCPGRQIKVRLEVPEATDFVPEERVLPITYSEEIIPVQFHATFSDEGEYELRVVAETVEGELLQNNNMSKAWMKVNDAGVAVGYFDSVRPESKFIARALLGTENTSVERTLVTAGRSVADEQQANIKDYDAVIIGDVEASAFRESVLIDLVNGVQEKGHGVVLLLTQRSGGRDGFQNSALRDILPVTIPHGLSSLTGNRKFVPSQPSHPVLVLGEAVLETVSLWRDAPELNGATAGIEVKEGAHVIARDQDDNPLIVVMRSGEGLVAVVLADTTFAWTFTSEDTQWIHRRFWRQLLIWTAGKEPELDVRVSVDEQRPVLGEDVQVRVVVTDRQGQPMRSADIKARVLQPDGSEALVPVNFSLRDDAFVGSYTTTQGGDHVAGAVVTQNGEPVGEDDAHFTARYVDLEMSNPLADHAMLRRMSATTAQFGGRFYRQDEANQLFENLQQTSETVKLIRTIRQPLWDIWPLFVLLLACMAAEWAIRKRKGLV